MGYGFKKMLADIHFDLSKYIALYSKHSKKPANKFSVLLHSPSFYVVANYRFLYWLKIKQEESHNYIFKLLLLIVLNGLRCISYQGWKITMKISISNWPEIGAGLYLSNKGGIIIGPKKMGENCIIHRNVTIGMNLENHHPEIGNNVTIGENSIVYCRIVNDDVFIENDTVVAKNIPKGKVIKGNPARIVNGNSDKSHCALANLLPRIDV